MEELYLTFRGRQVFLTRIVINSLPPKVLEYRNAKVGFLGSQTKESFRYEVDNAKEVLQKFVELKGYTEVSRKKIHFMPRNWSYKLNLWPNEEKALVQLATIIFN